MATKKKSPSAPVPTAKEDPDCEHLEHPVFAASFHLPENSWHGHRDWGSSFEDATEFQAFAAMVSSTLMELSGGSNRLIIGYLGDMLNVLPNNLRLAMMHTITNGLGLDIKAATDDLNTVEVNLVQRYEPLTAPVKQPPQIMTPGGGVGNAELIEKIKREGLRGA